MEGENKVPEREAKIDAGFAKLQRVAKILEEEGCDVEGRFINRNLLSENTSFLPTPITTDSRVRASYSDQGGLIIRFYNKWEDSNNLDRKRIEERLRAEGLY